MILKQLNHKRDEISHACTSISSAELRA